MPKTTERYSRPVFTQNLVLHTDQAQRVMNRVFSRVESAIYRTSAILMIIGDEKEANQVNTLISELIDGAAKDLQSDQARMDALRANNGIEALPEYTAPRTYTIQVSAPLAMRYVGLIRLIDQVVPLIDALWISGVMDDKQRKEATFQWQQRLLRVGRRILDIERRAWRSAQTQGKGEDVKANLGEDAKDDAASSDQELPESLLDEKDVVKEKEVATA